VRHRRHYKVTRFCFQYTFITRTLMENSDIISRNFSFVRLLTNGMTYPGRSVKFMLVIASTVILGSGSPGTHDHIYLSHNSESRETTHHVPRFVEQMEYIRRN
jgi:hypothetical protein